VAASLFQLERAAAAEPEGLLVLHHGRGTSERDLIGLAGLLDPERRLRVVTPRAPLQLAGSLGYHWYLVPRVGYPDPETFEASRVALADLQDRLWEESGIGPERTVLGGFSMGTVMSYATGLSPERPAVAGILAFSGFVPTVEGWKPSFDDRTGTRVFISHGCNDPVIGIEFAHRARELVEAGGLDLTYRESELGHQIAPAHLREAATWLDAILG
jgi:phospholipase/carboxylesterase